MSGGTIIFILCCIPLAALWLWFVWWNWQMCRMVEGVESMSDEVIDENLRREGLR